MFIMKESELKAFQKERKEKMAVLLIIVKRPCHVKVEGEELYRGALKMSYDDIMNLFVSMENKDK